MKKIYTLAILFSLFVSTIFAQTSIPNTTPVTENFDGMNATTTLVSNWRMGVNTASPTWAGGTATLGFQASSGAPTTGATYNWGSSSTERAAGVMTSSNFASPNSLMGFYQNTNASNITQLSVSQLHVHFCLPVVRRPHQCLYHGFCEHSPGFSGSPNSL